MKNHRQSEYSRLKLLTRLVPCVVAFALSALAANAQTANPAAVAVPRQPWIDQSNGFNAIAKKGGIDVVFLGDSITEGWRGAGKEVWAKHYAPQIAEGIMAIVQEIRTRTPSTKILLLGVFPRGEKDARVKIGQINEIIAKLDDGKAVFFLDIGPKFLQPDGTLTREIMPDLLHLSPAGYQIWADAIQAKLDELLK